MTKKGKISVAAVLFMLIIAIFSFGILNRTSETLELFEWTVRYSD